jgi:hypothetical protein
MSVHRGFIAVRWAVFCLLAAIFVNELSGIRRPTKTAFSQSIYQLEGSFFVSECMKDRAIC